MAPMKSFIIALFFAVAVAVVPGQSDASEGPTPSPEARHPRENTFLKRRWGIEILYVQQTAAGYMLDFRFKVLDANKAAPLFDRQTKPVLSHPESGAQLVVPTPAKTGALRNSNTPIAGNVYWMFFANPARLVDVGDLVTIDIGDFQVENLVVR